MTERAHEDAGGEPAGPLVDDLVDETHVPHDPGDIRVPSDPGDSRVQREPGGGGRRQADPAGAAGVPEPPD